MKKKQLVLLMFLAPMWSIAQVTGELNFYPPVDYAKVKIVFLVDNQQVCELQAANEPSFNFIRILEDEWKNKSLVFKVIVERPVGYVVDLAQTDLKWRNTRKKIYLRRPEDLFIIGTQQSKKFVSQNNIRQAQTTLLEVTSYNANLNDNQKFELYSAFANTYLLDKNYSAQQQYLDSLHQNVEFNGLNKGQIKRYAQERLSGILLSCNYNNLTMPDDDVSNVIAQDPEKLAHWNNMVNTLKPFFLTADSFQSATNDPKVIKAQLALLKREIF